MSSQTQDHWHFGSNNCANSENKENIAIAIKYKVICGLSLVCFNLILVHIKGVMRISKVNILKMIIGWISICITTKHEVLYRLSIDY